MFASLAPTYNMALFIVLAGVIWLAGTKLSYLVDALAEQAKVARAIMGLVVLAVITELPEMVTTMTAAWAGNAALALNNMFGGITMQTAILAVADFIAVKAVLTTFPRKTTPIIMGLCLIMMLSVLLAIALTRDAALWQPIGLASVSLALFYLLCLWFIHKCLNTDAWTPADLPSPEDSAKALTLNRYIGFTRRKLWLFIGLAALVILLSGTALTHVADTLAVQTGLGSSFIGVTLLAASTSLPELSTTIAAVRLRAYTMAISNILGSNLIMVFLIFPADIAYRAGPILNHIDQSAAFALCSGILVTGIYCTGLLVSSKRRICNLGIDSLLVLVVYAFSLIVLYALR